MPTNERLSGFGYDPHKCYYCYMPGMDTIEHIFVNGHFATSVWKYFSGLCSVECSNIPLHHYVMEWWGAQYKNVVHKIILHVIPIFIYWNLWKNMCGNKNGGR